MTEAIRYLLQNNVALEKQHVHREVDPNSLSTRLEDQRLYKLSDNERRNLAEMKRHEVVLSAMNSGFDVISSTARGKESDKIELKKEPIYGFREYSKVLFDLVGMRFVLKDNDEVDRFIDWADKKFDPPKEKYGHAGFWKKDLRSEDSLDRISNKHTQNDYKAVHLRVPTYYNIEGQLFLDFLEIQVMTPEQYAANKRNRIGYEQSKIEKTERRFTLEKL